MSEVIMIKSLVALITKIGSFYKTSVRCANVIVTNLRVVVLLEQEADNMGCFWAYKYHHVGVGSCHHFQLVVWCLEVLNFFQFFGLESGVD